MRDNFEDLILSYDIAVDFEDCENSTPSSPKGLKAALVPFSLKSKLTDQEFEEVFSAFSESLRSTVKTISGFTVSEVGEIQNQDAFLCCGITGVIFLLGVRNFLLMISASNETAATVTSSMTGIDESDLKDTDLQDGLTEIANMVAGNVKSRLDAAGVTFKLTPPFALQSDCANVIFHKRTIKKTMKFKHNDIILTMRLICL